MSARRVLLVEDENDIREVIQLCLETLEDWEVLLAASGAEGLALAGRESLDAVLLDVMMPEMDGIATFKQLKADHNTRHIPVVLLTAKVQPGDQQRFADLGVAGVIAKPFDPLELPNRIKCLLGW